MGRETQKWYFASKLRRKGKKYNKRGNLIHTITADNGKEFAKHQEIAKELDISFYFCKPCATRSRTNNCSA